MGEKRRNYSSAEWTIAVVVGVLLFWGLKSCSPNRGGRETYSQPRAVVSNSSFDASVRQVKEYIEANAKDASSVEYLEWSPVRSESDGTFLVRVKYRAKNSFGALVVENAVFRLSSTGTVMSAEQMK